ncbi:unnamed protein product [Meloidogyne enterolobii]|uniref:Uncharacterized protein n=1 Tax=Meloidogyne enterolobii TaxID=390850 RepID=A0ACB0YQH7_MELEN
MTPVIILEFLATAFPGLELNERAEKIKVRQAEQLFDTKYTKYRISNIHNPKVRFRVCNEERENFISFFVKIKIKKIEF